MAIFRWACCKFTSPFRDFGAIPELLATGPLIALQLHDIVAVNESVIMARDCTDGQDSHCLITFAHQAARLSVSGLSVHKYGSRS